MLPVLPSKVTPELDELIVRVLSASAALGKGLHPFILEEVARLMLKVNSYYTNAMEGNPSKLKDIDDALGKRFASDAAKRSFQLEHVAHIEVQEAMLERLRREPGCRICSQDFLCWLHEQFFTRLPEDMRVARTLSGAWVRFEPGKLRDRGVTVGRHEGPEGLEEIRDCLAKFEGLLSPEELPSRLRALGMASSHHRFLWIHPFPEGNGRVARLLTTAYGTRIGVGENQLWTVARAFARERARYDAQLAAADLPRRNDLDGRGPLSEEGLLRFCAYFLECCLDQIGFMAGMLRLEEFDRRYKRFIGGLVAEKKLSKSSSKVMARLLFQGEVPRGEVPSICAVKQRRATGIVRELLDSGVVRSKTPYGPLRLSIDAEMAAVLFPDLA